MRNLIKLFFTALLASVVTASCTKDDTKSFTMDNQQFVNEASSSNMLEIAAGNLAMQKSTNANVTAYGHHMVEDHGTASAEMAALVSSKRWSMPGSMMQKHLEKINMLNGLSGTQFDKQFAAMMVTSHQETISLFEQASSDTGVPDPDLRSFASSKLPTLRAHLQSAQQLQTQVGQ